MSNQCFDCGNATGGLRCKSCNGKALAREIAERRAQTDSQLLKDAGVGVNDYPLRFTNIPASSLAVRLNVSRNRVYQLVRDAQRRQRILAGESFLNRSVS